MKRITLILIILTFTASISFSQNLENVGAGVIDFLLRNPKTANKMNTTETVALDIIGDLLKTESQRKHQLEYASAGRNQVTVNSNDGRQAQLVKSENGKVFLLIDGVIYPIATELVDQAKGIETNQFESNKFIESNRFSDEVLKSQYINYYAYKVTSIYPYKWYKDFNYDNMTEFSEYKQKKETYYDNENFKIAIDYQTYGSGNIQVIIEVINDYNGKIFYTKKYDFEHTTQVFKCYNNNEISAGLLPVGTYLVSGRILDVETQKVLSSKTEKIQIIEGNSATREISNFEKNYRQNYISYSTPKKIFFWSSWKDINKNRKYDYDEFVGLNKESYSLSKDSLHVGLNFSEKSGEIIIQSLTKEGKLLGTTTRNYQVVSSNWIYPQNDPYRSLDYIDMVQINGTGKYKITVSFVEGGTYERELVITE